MIYQHSTYVGSMMSIHDPDYQEAMKFHHASSTMNYLLLQEGGENTNDPYHEL